MPGVGGRDLRTRDRRSWTVLEGGVKIRSQEPNNRIELAHIFLINALSSILFQFAVFMLVLRISGSN